MTDRIIPPNKRCPKCDTVKPFWQFHKDKWTKDGLRTQCKACQRVYHAAQVQAAANETKVPTITEKYCSQCKQTKPVSEFSRRHNIPNGYVNKCKPCKEVISSNWRKTAIGRNSTNKSRRLQYKKYGKAYAQTEKGKEDQHKRIKKYLKTEKGKDNLLRKRYGITLTEYEALFASQDGRCAICGSDGDGKKLHLDHCHSTSKVRGLLCNNCNIGIGLFQEDVTRLQNAIEYLKRHS